MVAAAGSRTSWEAAASVVRRSRAVVAMERRRIWTMATAARRSRTAAATERRRSWAKGVLVRRGR